MTDRPLLKIAPLDLTAWTVMAFLILLIGAVIAIGNPVGITAALVSNTAGPRGPLTLIFSRSPALDALQALITISPPVTGTLRALDSVTIEFIPAAPFQAGVSYTLTLAPGVVGANGERIRQAQDLAFGVRQPQVVYMLAADSGFDLWRVGLDGAAPEQLTFTEGRLFDFAAAPDGEWVVYSVINEQRGADLWLVNRDAAITRLLVNCIKDRCTAPAWSSDGLRIAYSRQPAGLNEADQPGAPRPWLVEPYSGQTRPVFDDSQIIGYGGRFSPDGRWLVTFDGVAGGLRALNLQSGEIAFFASNTGMLPEWSPDSRYLLYTNTEALSDGQQYHTVIYRADFASGEAGAYFGQDDGRDFAYAIPAWSPTGEQIVIGMRSEAESFAAQLWLVRPGQFRGPLIAAEPGYSYSSFHWDVWGRRLVMQRSDMAANYRPSVAVWEEGQEVRLLAPDGRNPQWLP